MIKNYGFKRNEIDDERAYKLGAIELPKISLRPDGQWGQYTPIDELQHTPNYDTYGCTIYGTENIQQTMERCIFGKTQEYDERYNYNIVKISPPGADPHDAAESFRNDGVISGLLPMTSTYEEYSKPRPVPTSILAKGIAHPYELRHQWLWTKPQTKTNRTNLIKEHLQYSPLGVSVTAWKEKNGVYVDDGKRNTHWTMLYGYNDKGWLIYDSYAPHRKILSFDHSIECCKRYQLVQSTRKQQLSLFQKVLQALFSWTNLLSKTEEPKIESPKTVPVLTLREKIYNEARNWLGKDASPSDKAPEELACAESVCSILQKAGVDIPLLISTIELKKWLTKSKLFKATTESKPGNIIISPTGEGNGAIPHGHTGIFSDKWIMSNDSKVGMWLENYTIDGWVKKFRTQGGYPIYYFEAI